MVVYLDILLIENFFVNLFLLTLTMQTLKKKVRYKRILVGAFLGSSYIITMVIPSLYFFSKTPFKLLVAFIMIFITLNDKKIINILKGTIIFVLYSIVLAGLCFYLSISNGSGPIPSAMLYNFSYKKLLLSIIIIYLLIYRVVIYVKERKILKNYVFPVDIYIDGQRTTVKALLDTGNELREGATNLPVMIVEKNIFKNLRFDNHSIFHVPYSVVSGFKGELEAIKPDKIFINIYGVIEEKKIILAFSDEKLSEHNDYSGLLPRGIIE